MLSHSLVGRRIRPKGVDKFGEIMTSMSEFNELIRIELDFPLETLGVKWNGWMMPCTAPFPWDNSLERASWTIVTSRPPVVPR